MNQQSDELRGKKVNLSGHFNEPVIIEDFRKLGSGYELRLEYTKLFFNKSFFKAATLGHFIFVIVYILAY